MIVACLVEGEQRLSESQIELLRGLDPREEAHTSQSLDIPRSCLLKVIRRKRSTFFDIIPTRVALAQESDTFARDGVQAGEQNDSPSFENAGRQVMRVNLCHVRLSAYAA